MSLQLIKELVDIPETTEAISEFRKKYNGSWMHFSFLTKHKEGLYRIDDLNSEKMCLRNDLGVGFHTPLDNIHSIKTPKWHRGLYQFDDVVGYMTQKPYRQWRRGMNQDSFVILNFSMSLFTNMVNNYTMYLDDCMKHIWNPKTYTYKEILNGTKSGYVVSPDFCVTLGIHDDVDFSLFYHTVYLGKIKDNKLTIENQAFVQEFYDSDLSWAKGLEL